MFETVYFSSAMSAASAAIINLEAVLKLPKGTEHFMSDLHGEHEAFTHILNNASGVIKEKVDFVLGKTVSEKERSRLATLIYYPVQKIEAQRAGHRQSRMVSAHALSHGRGLPLCCQ